MITGRRNIVSIVKSVSLKLGSGAIRKLLLVAGCWVLVGYVTYGQSAGDFRTNGDVTFSSATHWQTYNGTSWVAAGVAPFSTDGVITIRSGNTATLTASKLLDQLVVDNGGILTVNSGRTLTIIDGVGTDLDVTGTINNSGTITPTGTIVFNALSNYNHTQDGGAIPTATWDPKSNCNITGIISSTGFTVGSLEGQVFGNFIWNCSSQNTSVGFILAANFTVKGDFIVASTGPVNTNDNTLRMSNNASSFTINVTGNFVVQNSSTFKMNNDAGSCIMNVTGNFSLNSGNFTIKTGSASSTLSVEGDVTISGGTLFMNENDGTNSGILNVGGNFNFSAGSITAQQSGWPGNINFTGSSTHIYTKTVGATISNTINFSVLNGSTLDVGMSLINGSDGTFTLNSGAGIITAHPQGLSKTGGSGSIRVAGTRTFDPGADYTYNGSVAQIAGTGLTGANNLTINNTSTGVTLSNNVSVDGILTLTDGILTTTSAKLLSITNPSNLAISGGSVASFINGPVNWTLPANLVRVLLTFFQ